MNAIEMNAIAALDLEPIKVKLMHQESGEGWSRARADAVEFEYRRFLFLMKKFPDEQTAPLVDVDTFWHYHILDTMKYAADCDAVFGYFLHHFPYIGLRGEDDEAAHQRVGLRMKELYEATFGEDYIRHDTVPTAFSGVAPSVQALAFSGVAPNTGAVAFSGVAPGIRALAFSGVAPDAASATAFSGVAPGTAFSGVTARQAQSAIEQARQSSFYSARPRLSPAA